MSKSWSLSLLLLAACDDLVLTPSDDADDTAGGPSRAVVDALQATGDPGAGATAFVSRCEVCHTATGDTAKVGPALAPWMQSASDEATLVVMLEGRGLMEAIRMDAQEAADILAWLRREFGGEPERR